jgi:hypothetical protein
MRMVLRNGFAHPDQRFVSDDELDAMVMEAEKRSVVVQGVRCVTFAAGMLQVQFHDGRAAREAQFKTGWVNASEDTLHPTMKQLEGVHASVVAQGFAYSDYAVEDAV